MHFSWACKPHAGPAGGITPVTLHRTSGLATLLAEDVDAYLQGAGLAQDAAGDLRVEAAHADAAAWVAKKLMDPQQTDSIRARS